MNPSRRTILRAALSSTLLGVAAAAGILRPQVARAATGGLRQTMQALQRSNPVLNNAIRLKAPAVAVDGSNVFIEISCDLPDVDALIVFADRNPQPLIAAYQLAPEVLPALQMRIKVAETSQVWVVARSAGQFYKTAKSVRVTSGGCGVGVN